MGWKAMLGLIFFIIVVGLLISYWFIPWKSSEFFIKSGNTNFSTSNDSEMQFYSNMRFPTSEISYKIDESCTLQKKDDMERGFEIIENLTLLSFYLVNSNEEISVTCSSKNIREGDMFVAGEGGPTNISQAGNFNVIFTGMILLIKDSKCPKPNVAMHELFHVLGFKHSSNPNNIMYNFSRCDQEISQDMINLINELYSYPTYPDLVFEDVSASMNGRYLDLNLTVRNYGLKDAEASSVKIYADGKSIKEVELKPVEIGYGRSVYLSNLFISQLNVETIIVEIKTVFQELDKENNKIILQIRE